MDVTAALNSMAYVSSSPKDTRPCGAKWHFFSPDDCTGVRKYLQQLAEYDGVGDTIHSQKFYLTPQMLDDLYSIYRVQAYATHQVPGEAVFIPAGWAHQVCPAHSIQSLITNHYWT
jgi:[histone H3]-dimethyl-L-lysine9 demethylase